MLAVLLESRSRKQRRAGGAALSVAAHLAFIGAATAATAHGTPMTRAPDKPVWVNVPVPHDRTPAVVHEAARALPRIPPSDAIPIPILQIHLTRENPAINLDPKAEAPSWPSTPTCIECRAGMRGLVGDPLGDGKGSPESAEWRGSELLMRIETSAVPRYPERLRESAIEGSVLVEFAVDTTGRVDMTSLRILASTHALFTDAVRDALARFRFRPAEVGGRRVPALAQMPFEFRLQK